MTGATISIDDAASGFLRRRFVRAITASVLVLLSTAFTFFILIELFRTPPDVGNAALTAAALAISVVFLALLIFGCVVGLATVVGAIHRRLTALILIPFTFGIAALGLFLSYYGALRALGLEPPAPDTVAWQAWLAFLIVLAATAIALECLGWCWWQLRVSRDQFLAARGWRPPLWRPLSTMRQTLGLPSFISNFGRGRLALSFTYFLVAVLNLGLVAALLAPFSAFGARETVFVRSIIGLVCLGLIALNVLGVGALLQRLAARQATRLYQQAREWDARPPVVFLRAFDQDAAKLKPRSMDPFVRVPAGCGASRTVDELLLESGSVYGPVIAIGDPRDPTPPLGAARVFVEGSQNEWQNVVHSLLSASVAVVMCPSTSAGVQWELDLIADAAGRLNVILLANPNLSPEQTVALFQRVAPAAPMKLERGQAPIAAYLGPDKTWRVLSTKRGASVQTYTVAINYALQATLGMKGAVLVKPKRRREKARA